MEKGWSQQKELMPTAPFHRVDMGAHQVHQETGEEEKSTETVFVLASILQKTILAVQEELLVI